MSEFLHPTVSAFSKGSADHVSMDENVLRKIECCSFSWLGRVEYLRAWELQRGLAKARAGGRIPDTLLLLEHPPTYTLGRRGDEKHLLVPWETLGREGVAVHRIDRGGDITFHGPGQLVGYPVISLKNRQGGASRYLRNLEEVIILALAQFGVESGRFQRYTGVWVGDEKIAAIGVKIDANRITQHGFALNVTTDLSYFEKIVPCGIRGRGITTLARILGKAMSLEEVSQAIVAAFAQVFVTKMLPVTGAELWSLSNPHNASGVRST